MEFEDTRDADDAVYELNGKELCGERVVVEHARGPRRDRDGYGGGHWGSGRSKSSLVKIICFIERSQKCLFPGIAEGRVKRSPWLTSVLVVLQLLGILETNCAADVFLLVHTAKPGQRRQRDGFKYLIGLFS